MEAKNKFSGATMPGYHQIRQYVFGLLSAADSTDAMVPLTTERELCEIFNVSRGTVRRALQMLTDEGLLVRRPHYGTFISPDAVRSNTHGQVIGVVAGDGEMTYMDGLTQQMICGVFNRMTEHGYFFRLINFFGNAEKTLKAELSGKLAGIVWLWMPEHLRHLQEHLSDIDFPYVLNMPMCDIHRGDVVTLDFVDYGYALTKKLLEHNYRDILFVDQNARNNIQQKIIGIQKAFAEFGINWKPEEYVHASHGEAIRRIRQILSEKHYHVINCNGPALSLQSEFPDTIFISTETEGKTIHINPSGVQPVIPAVATGEAAMEILHRKLTRQSTQEEHIKLKMKFEEAPK